jgi:hypothetical protein
MSDYFDYRFKFTDLTKALGAMQELRTVGILSATGLPENMLGDARDATGNVVDRGDPEAAFAGRKGRAAFTYTDDMTQQSVTVPACGDPDSWYIHIRATVSPSDLTFDPTTYGLVPSDPDESAAVLGVWA